MSVIGKNQNTFAKMQREREKKRKAEEKRLRRQARKSEHANETAETENEAPTDPGMDSENTPTENSNEAGDGQNTSDD